MRTAPLSHPIVAAVLPPDYKLLFAVAQDGSERGKLAFANSLVKDPIRHLDIRSFAIPYGNEVNLEKLRDGNTDSACLR